MADYISREAAIAVAEDSQKKVCPRGLWGRTFALDEEQYDLWQNLIERLEAIPAADVEPVRYGRWEECDWVDVDEHGFGTRRAFKAGLRCSQCACVFKKELLWKRNWCPSCGAKMDLEEEQDDER